MSAQSCPPAVAAASVKTIGECVPLGEEACFRHSYDPKNEIESERRRARRLQKGIKTMEVVIHARKLRSETLVLSKG